MKRCGIPAAAVLAGGISRHGSHCACPYCAPPVIPSAYQRPIVEVQLDDIDNAPLNPPVPVQQDAISQAFARARETVKQLEAERLVGEWSPAQAADYGRAA